MIAAGWGRSVNIASIAGKDGNPWMSAHAPSKGGLIALTKSAAKEVATSGVLITCVVPVIESGLTESASEQERALFLSRVPMGRMGEPTNSPSSSRGWPPDGARSPQPAYDLSGGRAVY